MECGGGVWRWSVEGERRCMYGHSVTYWCLDGWVGTWGYTPDHTEWWPLCVCVGVCVGVCGCVGVGGCGCWCGCGCGCVGVKERILWHGIGGRVN